MNLKDNRQRRDAEDAEDRRVNLNELTEEIIGAAIEVHRTLGSGLLESAYELALESELRLRGLEVCRQVPVRVNYKGSDLGDAFRIDMLVQNEVVLEIKAVEEIQKIHRAQLLTYLRLSERRLGLLLNFHASVMKDGINRIVNDL